MNIRERYAACLELSTFCGRRVDEMFPDLKDYCDGIRRQREHNRRAPTLDPGQRATNEAVPMKGLDQYRSLMNTIYQGDAPSSWTAQWQMLMDSRRPQQQPKDIMSQGLRGILE